MYEFKGIESDFKKEPNLRLLFLDLETTGFGNCDIVELGYKVDSKPTRKFRFKPTKPITQGASNVHGIYAKDVATKPYFRNSPTMQKLQRLIDGSVLVAHNAQFDVGVLSRHGVYVKRYICTKRLGMLLSVIDGTDFNPASTTTKNKHTLDVMSKYYNVKIERPIHDAGTDVDITFEVCKHIINRLDELMGGGYTNTGLLYRIMWLSRINPNKGNPIEDARNLTYLKFIKDENQLDFGLHHSKSLYDVFKNHKPYIKQCFNDVAFNAKWKYLIKYLINEAKWINANVLTP